MKIRMLTSERGSLDGIRSTVYAKGSEYDLTATAGERDLASAFVGAGMAEEVGIKSITKRIEAEIGQIEEIVEARVDGVVIHPAPVKPGKRQK